jgi:methyl-accepting chemotaxis protein
MKRLLAAFRNLNLGPKIALIAGLLIVPLAMMTVFYVLQLRKDMDFVAKELDGVAYGRGVWAAVRATADDDHRAEMARVSAELRRQAPRAAAFDAQAAVDAFAVAMAQRSQDDALVAGQTALQKIADGANLTLDPNLDSFYLMESLFIRIPEALVAAGELHDALKPAVEGRKLGAADFGRIGAAQGRFNAAGNAMVRSLETAQASNKDGSVRNQIAARVDQVKLAVDRVRALVASEAAASTKGEAVPDFGTGFSQADAALLGRLDEVWQAGSAELQRLLADRESSLARELTLKLALIGLCLVLAGLCIVAVIRSIRNPVADLVGVIRSFEAGDYAVEVAHTEARNEMGEIARALAKSKEVGAHNALTLAALEGSPSMLMITDPREHIIYMSRALRQLLARLEPSFRKGKAAFTIAGMIGQHIDCYRANPELTRTLLLDNGESRKVRYDIGGRTIMVDMAYVHNDAGARIGHTLEWRDMTEELAAQAEIAGVVAAASEGDFSRRLALDGKTGFAHDVASGLNEVSTTVQGALKAFSEAMAALARGDLTHVMATRYKGMFGELQGSIDETTRKLADVVMTIQATTSDIVSSAREISAGADDLSKRTEEQASSLEETAATTEELAASVKASALAARQAAALSDEATGVAQSGGEIVTEAVGAMSRIEQASDKISAITSIIDDIAFQTNLLALNAAVEAARAGDAGKGFAVVASEVRALAQRSSEAAKDISGLIRSSTGEIAQGAKLVHSAGQALGKIVDASQRVASTVSEISTAASEQSHGIDEMSQAVAHMDEMTQQNAALAEESAASATSLAAQVDRLEALVAAFKVRRGDGAPDQGGVSYRKVA